MGFSRADRLVQIHREALWHAARAAPALPPGPLDATQGLPDPVRRYLQRVLPAAAERTPDIVTLRQSGTLRTGAGSSRWLRFTAMHQAACRVPGCCWDARIALPFGLHMRVDDHYLQGIGGGSVHLQSLLQLAADRDNPQLNAAELHRYLAEAVWYPMALLPGNGVVWQSVDEHSALATLHDGTVSVSLTFRFNEQDDVISVHTPGRFRAVRGGYELTPWEGRFSHHEVCDGYRVPRRAEVGWYLQERFEPVWRGMIEDVEYR